MHWLANRFSRCCERAVGSEPTCLQQTAADPACRSGCRARTVTSAADYHRSITGVRWRLRIGLLERRLAVHNGATNARIPCRSAIRAFVTPLRGGHKSRPLRKSCQSCASFNLARLSRIANRRKKGRSSWSLQLRRPRASALCNHVKGLSCIVMCVLVYKRATGRSCDRSRSRSSVTEPVSSAIPGMADPLAIACAAARLVCQGRQSRVGSALLRRSGQRGVQPAHRSSVSCSCIRDVCF
jgi:hypothetical protein